MKLFDTHCHIHEATFELSVEGETQKLWAKAGKPNPNELIKQATDAGVVGMVCVGTTAEDSALAVKFVQDRPNCWASIGIHPHEAKMGKLEALKALLSVESSQNSVVGGREEGTPGARSPQASTTGRSLEDGAHDVLVTAGPVTRYPRRKSLSGHDKDLSAGDPPPSATPGLRVSKIVAVGECGLDYFYAHSPKKDQIKALRFQIELALEHNLPLIFHVREAFDDFWPIFDEYKSASAGSGGQRIRGVVHSFTDNQANLDKILERDLYVGLNGIITFTKNDWQLEVAKNIPLSNLLCETDAPFLTPAPIRGRVNAPENVSLVAEFLAKLRGESPSILAEATTQNAFKLFSL